MLSRMQQWWENRRRRKIAKQRNMEHEAVLDERREILAKQHDAYIRLKELEGRLELMSRRLKP